jgi:hypothetical protein
MGDRILMEHDEVGVRVVGTERPEDEEVRVVTADFDETDINRIVKRFGPATVAAMDFGKNPLMYLDGSELTTYASLWDRVNMVSDYFAHLPAETRGHFENDPRQLLEAMADDSRREELVKFGIWPEVRTPGESPAPAPAPAPVPPA